MGAGSILIYPDAMLYALCALRFYQNAASRIVKALRLPLRIVAAVP